jgi:hypothetical protein
VDAAWAAPSVMVVRDRIVVARAPDR